MTRNVAVVVGSLRKGSYNRMIANALVELAPKGLEFSTVGIGELPLYLQDLDEEKRPPGQWTSFRESIKAADALLFATPEYNRSIPGSLKNAIDVGSRPMSDNVWKGRPAAVVSASPGAIGGFGANQHLRQCLVAVNCPCMPGPEAYIGGVSKLVDEHGRVTNEDARKFLEKFMAAFAAWVEKNAK